MRNDGVSTGVLTRFLSLQTSYASNFLYLCTISGLRQRIKKTDIINTKFVD